MNEVATIPYHPKPLILVALTENLRIVMDFAIRVPIIRSISIADGDLWLAHR
jgi:hypothetical protein